MKRHGTGLVEVSVAVALTATLMSVILSITGFASRAIARVDRELDAMQAAQLALERIEDDLQRVLLKGGNDRSLFHGVGAAGQSVPELAFDASHLGPSGRAAVYVGLPVVYRTVPAERGLVRLTRNATPLAGAVFRQVTFRLELVPALAAGRTLPMVRTRIQGVDPTDRTEFTLEGLTVVEPLARWSAHTAYNPNPDTQAPVLGFAPPR